MGFILQDIMEFVWLSPIIALNVMNASLVI